MTEQRETQQCDTQQHETEQHETESYDFRRRPGPAADRQPALNVLQVSTPVKDNKLIRLLVGEGNVSGFGWRACMVMLGVMYQSETAWKRAEQIWLDTLQGATAAQLEEIHEGLTSLVVLTEQAMG